MTNRPNFLFIMTDQHRADWLGCAGHPVVKTPNIDALAGQGTRFEQFFAASPVCMPNRASFMTGRYPSVHGLRYNGCTLPERANTFVDVLRASGYRTASIGKSHLQPFTDHEPIGRDVVEDGPIADAWKPEAGAYDNEEPHRYDADARYDFPTPYYGFDHVDMVTSHGDQAGGHYQQWFRDTHPNWRDLIDRKNELPHNYTCPQAFRTPIPEDSYSTAYVRDRGRDFLRAASKEDAPFFAFVSFPDPHHPFNPPGKYWDMYSPNDFDVPVRFEDHQNPPPPLTHARAQFEAGGSPPTPQTGFMASDQHIREAMALTAGSITMIDDAVGELIAMLKETGQYDNTVIVFNADHGDYLGDFNMLLKGAWPRDGITRVPMIWSDPADRTEKVSDAIASTIDLSATILERAGTAPYHGMQGRSLMPSLRDGAGHREAVLVEFNDSGRRMGFPQPARMRAWITPDWHLAIYKGEGWGELYDRHGDPHHCNNLWDSPEHANIRGELTLALADALIGQMDESPLSKRLA